MPAPEQDFLADLMDVAGRAGESAGYADLGYGQPAKAAKAPAAYKPYDPLDNPYYKQAELARKELADNENLYRQRLKDFDHPPGSP